MTAQAIDVVISADRHNLDRAEFTKDAVEVRRSLEFAEFVKKTIALGVKEGVFAPAADALVSTALTVALRAGYLAKQQEIGVSELEAFFPQ